ncbi:MAG TPA: asparagine synthase (glutamine-hydrolyzing) [Candidatus Nanoarchaeia archaeon]|nr:asparagine synthase (glutamine-hydrolyzing) [Candidatus Nanoarchaeia archaeon]
MCGITGIFGEDNKDLIKIMTKSLDHRGPDQEGFYIDKNISLGYKRLAIIDLSEKGSQPMFNETKDLVLIFNGEIYNYKEIKKNLKNHIFQSETDSEVIIHGYEEYKEKILKYLDGMFAFCLYNKKTKEIFLARDRLGKKPLYYTIINQKLYFSSELKTLLLIPEIIKEINYIAIDEFLTLRHINGPKTIIKNIFKLQPGHYLTYPNLNIQKYWSINLNINYNLSKEFYQTKIYNLLKNAVEKRLISDVPLGIFLSGGLDSSIITALTQKKDIKTYSVHFSHYNNQETKNAKLISELFNTTHKEIAVYPEDIKLLPKIIYHMDEPIADPACIPTYILAKEAKKEITVSLLGEGADEIFGGYEQYKILMLKNKLNFIPFKGILPKIAKKTPKKILNKIFKYSEGLGEKGIKRFENLLEEKEITKNYLTLISFFDDDEKKSLYSQKLTENNQLFTQIQKELTKKEQLNKLMIFETKTEMVDCLLMRVDKMTMAHSLEARAPFLDYKLVELAFSIPEKYKIKNLTSKYILKESVKKILPKQIINTKKQRFFVPIDYWFENELKEIKNNFLKESELSKLKIINQKYLDHINKNFSNSKLYYSRQLWNLINLEFWFKIFYLNEKNIKI